MTVFLESPWPAIFFGIIGLAILAVVLVRTGRGIVLLAMGGVVVITLGGLALERFVVTERERVENTLYDTAAAIEANDVNRVAQYLSPSAAATLQRARSVLSQYRFTSVRLRNLKIEINKLTSPPSAEAKFLALFSLVDLKGQLPYNNGEIGMTVDLQLENGRWRIVGYKEGNPRDYLQ